MNLRWIVLGMVALVAAGCDRRVEAFVPGEKPQTPDLAKIFPAGADRAASPEAVLPGAPGRGAAPVQEQGAPIEGTIELAPELVARVPASAVLFLMARLPGGGPPVAAQRIDTLQFPIAFSLGAEDRMMAEVPFAGPMQISARIDADGNATTRGVGDLLGASATAHQPGDRGVVVRIADVQATATDASALSAAGSVANSAATDASAAAIEGTLELAPDLADKVPPGAVLFIIARNAPAGPPLAVVRVADPSFPQSFSIGPDDRMLQSVPFAGNISISVRVDGDGDAMTRNPGDLQGGPGTPNAPGDRGVALLIDEVL
jgi:hypothetical protein